MKGGTKQSVFRYFIKKLISYYKNTSFQIWLILNSLYDYYLGSNLELLSKKINQDTQKRNSSNILNKFQVSDKSIITS